MDTIRKALNLNTTFARIEFWAAATISAFILFFYIVEGFDYDSAPFISHFEQAGIPFEFYKHYFIPQLVRNLTLIVAFLYLNFIVIPRLAAKQRLGMNIDLVVFVFAVMGVIFGV